MLVRTSIQVMFAVACLCLTACSQQSRETDIRQQSADATRQVKKGAQELARDTKAAAQGVRDGLEPDRQHPVDINSASEPSLAMLPGVNLIKAHAIVKARPYSSTHGLVTKGVLTHEQYSKIEDRVVAR
ncbi:MAG: helix-hairpin-helix domain-containing protein [Acidobacteriaceae bacterium]